jgi:hypothetical protein
MIETILAMYHDIEFLRASFLAEGRAGNERKQVLYRAVRMIARTEDGLVGLRLSVTVNMMANHLDLIEDITPRLCLKSKSLQDRTTERRCRASPAPVYTSHPLYPFPLCF